MSRIIFFAGILIANAVYLQAADTGDTSMKKEFIRRSKIVTNLSRIYREYEKVHESQGANESQTLFENFLSKFEREFDNSDTWLYETLTEEDGILDQALIDNKYHYQKTKLFLKVSTSIINTALDMNHVFQCHHSNLTEMKRIESFRGTVNEQLKQITDKTLKYLKEEAWKDQFVLDIDDIVRTNGSDYGFHLQVHEMLKSKYPFRTWFVLTKSITDEADDFICSFSDEPSYEERIGRNGEKKLIVLQVKAGYRRNRNYAEKILNNIATDRTYWTCKKRRARSIYRESRYRCHIQRLTFFSLIDVKRGGRPQYIASDNSLVFNKIVYRSSWLNSCKQRYKVILFA